MNTRRKGYTAEKEVVDFLRSKKVECFRVPLSGQGAIKGDVHMVIRTIPLQGEVKSRKTGPKNLINQLKDNDILFIRENGGKKFVFMELDTFGRIL